MKACTGLRHREKTIGTSDVSMDGDGCYLDLEPGMGVSPVLSGKGKKSLARRREGGGFWNTVSSQLPRSSLTPSLNRS